MDASLGELLPRIMGSMVAVLALMWVVARFTRTKRFGKTFGTRFRGDGGAKDVAPIEVLSRQPLGRNTSVSIVRTGNKTLVLGITETTVSVLTELGGPATQVAATQPITSQPMQAATAVAQMQPATSDAEVAATLASLANAAAAARSRAEHPSKAGAAQAATQRTAPALSLVNGMQASNTASTNASTQRETQRTGTAARNEASDTFPTTEQAWKGLLGQVRERTVRR